MEGRGILVGFFFQNYTPKSNKYESSLFFVSRPKPEPIGFANKYPFRKPHVGII